MHFFGQGGGRHEAALVSLRSEIWSSIFIKELCSELIIVRTQPLHPKSDYCSSIRPATSKPL